MAKLYIHTYIHTHIHTYIHINFINIRRRNMETSILLKTTQALFPTFYVNHDMTAFLLELVALLVFLALIRCKNILPAIKNKEYNLFSELLKLQLGKIFYTWYNWYNWLGLGKKTFIFSQLGKSYLHYQINFSLQPTHG